MPKNQSTIRQNVEIVKETAIDATLDKPMTPERGQAAIDAAAELLIGLLEDIHAIAQAAKRNDA